MSDVCVYFYTVELSSGIAQIVHASLLRTNHVQDGDTDDVYVGLFCFAMWSAVDLLQRGPAICSVQISLAFLVVQCIDRAYRSRGLAL